MGSTFPRGAACRAAGGSAVRVGEGPGGRAALQPPLLPPHLDAELRVTPAPTQAGLPRLPCTELAGRSHRGAGRGPLAVRRQP